MDPSEFFNESGGPRQDFGERIEGLAACIQEHNEIWLSARYGAYMKKGREVVRDEKFV